MQFRNILVTGGAGFVGANLARLFSEHFPKVRITALDNLKRRGSELNLAVLARSGVHFVHGDIRSTEDLQTVGDVDLLIDCAAEPSVTAGLAGSPEYLLNTNLVGTLNCLELARARGAAFLLLSTSRVYPIAGLNTLPYVETDTRYRWDASHPSPGFSERGIGEEFPLVGARSLYGASKLSAELVVAEYAYSYGLKALINRCGILTGPGQFSRVDQGVITHFLASHHFRQPLSFIGFGGNGKQVRDILHVKDLFELLLLQLERSVSWKGDVYNVGGGPDRTVSLKELAAACAKLTGHTMQIASRPETNPVDVRLFVTDTRLVEKDYAWQPSIGVEQILIDVHTWIEANSQALKSVLAC